MGAIVTKSNSKDESNIEKDKSVKGNETPRKSAMSVRSEQSRVSVASTIKPPKT